MESERGLFRWFRPARRGLWSSLEATVLRAAPVLRTSVPRHNILANRSIALSAEHPAVFATAALPSCTLDELSNRVVDPFSGVTATEMSHEMAPVYEEDERKARWCEPLWSLR